MTSFPLTEFFIKCASIICCPLSGPSVPFGELLRTRLDPFDCLEKLLCRLQVLWPEEEGHSGQLVRSCQLPPPEVGEHKEPEFTHHVRPNYLVGELLVRLTVLMLVTPRVAAGCSHAEPSEPGRKLPVEGVVCKLVLDS